MFRVTRHIGFGLTYSTTFMHVCYTARLLNSLDHIIGGRVAMNLVTSTCRSDAANFGFDQLVEYGARYDRMEEFGEVCLALWDSAEPDAMVWDAAAGRVRDPAKVHGVSHRGRFFQVEGPSTRQMGGVSHTEGQGWGLLFTITFADVDAFKVILDWTTSTLHRNRDALHSWRYVPGAPNISAIRFQQPLIRAAQTQAQAVHQQTKGFDLTAGA